ncbi:MAG: hypothetical protein JW715_02665 [Sedimentisphaerales bacterium]|nr:hypothetical protein [Sedimentisphaerales bacterium]
MAKKDYSEYQKSVISNYYTNLDTIMLGKLGELLGELYLAETEKKKKQLWQRVHKAMEKLNIPETIINHIMEHQDVEILAKNLQDWQKAPKRKQ